MEMLVSIQNNFVREELSHGRAVFENQCGIAGANLGLSISAIHDSGSD